MGCEAVSKIILSEKQNGKEREREREEERQRETETERYYRGEESDSSFYQRYKMEERGGGRDRQTDREKKKERLRLLSRGS